jgi:uncharacterized membrane protein YgdD (TMEM256/DUF423 family)
MKPKIIILVAMISGALVVALGAIGSHALQDILNHNNRVETYQTAVRYHAFHTIALLCIGILARLIRSHIIVYGTYCMLAGMVLFSGSLYLLGLTNHLYLAYITPVGGILLVVSWLFLFYAVYRGEWISNYRG